MHPLDPPLLKIIPHFVLINQKFAERVFVQFWTTFVQIGNTTVQKVTDFSSLDFSFCYLFHSVYSLQDADIHLHIIKNGSHLGALGAFLDQIRKKNKRKPQVES